MAEVEVQYKTLLYEWNQMDPLGFIGLSIHSQNFSIAKFAQYKRSIVLAKILQSLLRLFTVVSLTSLTVTA